MGNQGSGKVPSANKTVMSLNLDLKTSLTLRFVATALSCFLIAAGLALFATYRDVRQVNARVADLLVQRLEIQLSHIESGIDVARASQISIW
jgi:hypothetical protein